MAPAAAGSVPTAALFFLTYESAKIGLGGEKYKDSPFVHMAAASIAEVVACMIRVPVESKTIKKCRSILINILFLLTVAKQRRQSSLQVYDKTAFQILYNAFKTEGFRGIYRGFGATILREIPFSFIQFPLWEYFKANWTETTGLPLGPHCVALCGALAGGIAAGITTPLDVAKTRIMLADQNETKALKNPIHILRKIYKERGVKGIFAGFAPRILWITLGGAVFFGFYDLTTRFISPETNNR